MASYHIPPPKKVPINFKDELNVVKQSSLALPTTPLLFHLHYDGSFCRLPTLKYEYGKVMLLKVCRSNMMSFSKMLELIVYKTEDDVRSVYFCNHMKSLETGLTLIECDFDMRKLYAAASRHGLIDVYVAHDAINLALYYFKNIGPDFSNDMEKLVNYKAHEKSLMFAKNASLDEMLQWEELEGRSPPLRKSPSNPRVKGIHDLIYKNLFLDFLHSESLDDPYEFSDSDVLVNLYGPGVVSLDVVFGSSQPFAWHEDGLIKLTNDCNDLYANEVVLEDGDPSCKEFSRSSVHPRQSRRVSQMKKSTGLNFGPRHSIFRNVKMLSLCRLLHRLKFTSGLSNNIKWFLVDGRLEVKLVSTKNTYEKKSKFPRHKIRKILLSCNVLSRLHAML